MDAAVIDSFRPDADPRAFRRALGAFATGVTVVTTGMPDGPIGITANSFASVSLDPPLILWSPAKSSSRFGIFAAAQHFAVHVLAADQKPICDAFTRSWNAAFEGLDWANDAQGTPLIEGMLARYVCQTEATYDAGDHLVMMGRVLTVEARAGTPLVFHAGVYGQFEGGGV